MDKFAYIAMSAAKEAMLAQSRIAHNLANAKTTGFKADLTRAKALNVEGDGLESRAFALTTGTGYDLSSGQLITTGNPTDLAIEGEGWFVVQAQDGSEALTRNGAFEVAASGMLQTSDGLPVLGDAGPIILPPSESISVGADGTVSVRPLGAPANTVQVVGRLRLVKPEPTQLVKQADGLFAVANGEILPSDASVRVRAGALEASNVNTVEALTELIDLSRRFEMHIKMLSSAQQNDEALDRLLQA
ncbi:MAG: flagellar basal-body rod protein FlgF [Gammaproteobacteria bacterium]|nr:MAG: flagellar basal-body rod protein FlgF [Gammaproteobacteria bacterium]